MSDNIFRKGKSKENPYSQIANSAIRDERLTWKARGVLVYLLSLPNDWTIWQSELAKHSENDGREALESAIDELREYGYITVEVERDAAGHILRFAYEVYEEPVEVDPDTRKKIEQKREKKKARERRKQEKREQKKHEQLKSAPEADQETGIPLMGENISSPLTGKPLTGNPQLLNTKLTNNLSKKDLCVSIDSETDEIMRSAQDSLGIAPEAFGKTEIHDWIHEYGAAHVIAQIEIIAAQGSQNPLRSLREAVQRPWQASKKAGKALHHSSKKARSSKNTKSEDSISKPQAGKWETVAERLKSAYGK